MKLIINTAAIVLILSLHAAMAWQPEGWCYMNWPYAYSPNGSQWHYFDRGEGNYGNIQVVNLDSGNWYFLGFSHLSGYETPSWAYFQWPYAYSAMNGSWYYFGQTQTQWTYAFANSDWTVLGDKGDLPLGYWTASAPDEYNLSVTVGNPGQIEQCYLKVYFADGTYPCGEASFAPADIDWDGTAFTAAKTKHSANEMGEWTEQYRITGTFQNNGSITGSWFGFYRWEPAAESDPKTNSKGGLFTAWR